MNSKLKTNTITWILRSSVVLGGLALTACAPMALPGEDGAQPASAGVAQLATATPLATDDSTTATPGATQTTPEATHTLQPGMTGTAVTGQSVEFTGTIELVDASALVVSGRRVVITAATEIKFQPQKGLTVKVQGTLQADGTVLAREIKSVPAAQATQQPGVTRTPGAETTRTPQSTRQAGESEFRGTVSAISGSTFVVNGITVVVNGEIKGPIAVGDLVKVHGVFQADGSVVAREIERADLDDSGRGGSDDDSDDRDGDDDSSGRGGDDDGSDDRGGDDDRSGRGDDDDDDDNSGHGGDDDNDDDDDGGHGGDDDKGDDD